MPLQKAADQPLRCTPPGPSLAGQNNNGQLGTGGDADSSVPVAAAAGRTFAALSAGGSHTCGLEAGGKAICWGELHVISVRPANAQFVAAL